MRYEIHVLLACIVMYFTCPNQSYTSVIVVGVWTVFEPLKSVQTVFRPIWEVFEHCSNRCEKCSNSVPTDVKSVQTLFELMWKVFEQCLNRCEKCSNSVPTNVKSVPTVFQPIWKVFEQFSTQSEKCLNTVSRLWHPSPSCAPPVAPTHSPVRPELAPSQSDPHPDPFAPVLAFACTLQHLRCLCKRTRRAAIPLRLARTLLTNHEHSRPKCKSWNSLQSSCKQAQLLELVSALARYLRSLW